MKDFMDLDIFEESEITGKAPSASAPPVSKHTGPTAQKKEISATVYNQALADLKKSFNESIDLLSNVTVVQESEEELLEQKMADIYENAIVDAFLEAADNGPIYEAAKHDNKSEIKKLVTTLRKELNSKLDKSYNFVDGKTALRNIEIIITAMAKSLGKGLALAFGADVLLSGINRNLGRAAGTGLAAGVKLGTAVGGASATLAVLASNYTWQTVGSICVDKADATDKLNEIKNIASEYLKGNESLHVIKVNKTISEKIISKFKYKLNGGVLYLLVVDDQAPKELTILSKPLKEVKVKDEDKKGSSEKSDSDDKSEKKEDKNVNESYELIFDTESDDE